MQKVEWNIGNSVFSNTHIPPHAPSSSVIPYKSFSNTIWIFVLLCYIYGMVMYVHMFVCKFLCSICELIVQMNIWSNHLRMLAAVLLEWIRWKVYIQDVRLPMVWWCWLHLAHVRVNEEGCWDGAGGDTEWKRNRKVERVCVCNVKGKKIYKQQSQYIFVFNSLIDSHLYFHKKKYL